VSVPTDRTGASGRLQPVNGSPDAWCNGCSRETSSAAVAKANPQRAAREPRMLERQTVGGRTTRCANRKRHERANHRSRNRHRRFRSAAAAANTAAAAAESGQLVDALSESIGGIRHTDELNDRGRRGIATVAQRPTPAQSAPASGLPTGQNSVGPAAAVTAAAAAAEDATTRAAPARCTCLLRGGDKPQL
jgi:hypothetical protein